ncbi:MAG TPA: tannase/feruloyl esterase family alpha/beta hydrolase [Trebonia sp.]|nr:tannase/feruloyl esterase family alpha/beta hydrolase [Trebonia sp.]
MPKESDRAILNGSAPAYSYYDGCSDGGREAWVESAKAPTSVTAAAVSGGSGPPGSGTATVEYTRPVFPYPTEVRYSGHGSVKTASSYTPYTPGSAVHKDDYQWAGYPFTSGYEQWCTLTDDGKSLVCRR